MPLEGTCALSHLSLVSDFEIRLRKVGVRGPLAITPIQAVFLSLEPCSSRRRNAGMRQEQQAQHLNVVAAKVRQLVGCFTSAAVYLENADSQIVSSRAHVSVLRPKVCSGTTTGASKATPQHGEGQSIVSSTVSAFQQATCSSGNPLR